MNNQTFSEIANSIAPHYFGKQCYYKKGYMADWIWNAATEKGINELTIDILNYKIHPRELQLKPLVIFLPKLKETINKQLEREGFSPELIIDAKFHIKLFEVENRLRCTAILTDSDNNKYIGKEYTEYPYDNNFKIFKSSSENDMDWANEADNALNTSEWFGAILRYVFYFGKRKFNTFYNQKQLKKNALLGTIFQICLIVLLFYFLYKYSVG
ncbi:MAG: hypothetical protein CL530_07450 [Aequorivita sp.]|nr:hypothetical protein [Aequorivita sp.]